ncbi:MAG: hypothetical protein G3M70_09350 [Candidatus Nitronauta litoralis]|uniref:DUF2059 domain-containing protein n=1 Tax=Candidatus Nitronauta litoralis TaxID=2705533 RepID=A0A7T0BWA5_9BACT|nr:MAG: hypothetical protein G3M70_09350 [Candidatus Nitronauta litoralis]
MHDPNGMIQVMQTIQKNIRLFLLTVLVVGVLSGSAIGAQAPASSVGASNGLVRQLLADSGLDAAKAFMAESELPTEMFSDPLSLLYMVAPDGKLKLIRELYQGTFDSEEYFDAIQRRFQKDLNSQHAHKVLEFLATPLGQQSVQMEVQFLNDYLWFLSRGKDFLGHYREKMGPENLPTGQRLFLTGRMLRARDLVSLGMRVNSSILAVASPLKPYYNQGPSDDKEKIVKEDLPEYIKTLHIMFLSRIYREMPDDRFKELVKFYESSAGRWYQRTRNRGQMDAQDRMNQQARMRVASVMKAFEAGKGEKEILYKMFPPGIRQLFVRKRDPFQPLIYAGMDKEKKEKVEEVPVPVDRFVGTDKRFETIPLEAYNQLKEIDPQLYQDLEFYGKLFQERTELEALSDEEFEEEVSRYQALIEKAKDVMANSVLTPLQVGYGNLQLVGLMDNGIENVGLIQATDSKGYTVKKGMLIGPNFGVVESINEERIEVVERARDHEGNILSTVQFIAFADPEGSEEK